AIASAGFVWLEARIANRYTRIDSARWNQYASILISLASAIAFPLWPRVTSAAFYVWTGSQAMMLLPHFWVLALEVWDSRRARRVFPLLTGCGLVGGLLAGGFAGWLTPVAQDVGLPLMFFLLLTVAHLLTRAVERHRIRRETEPPEATATGSRWEIVRRSNYVRYLAFALALSVFVGTLIDFQFKFLIQDVYPSPAALTEFLGKFYLVMNALALFFQFGPAGWILNRIGLAASTGIQPALVMAFAWWVALTTGWWAVVAMRWVQGVVLQGLGKSTAEIYYMAVRPNDRRRIKPAIDTLVERWADAVVGVMLIVVLGAAGVAIPVIAIVTTVVAAVWLVVLLRLNRQYARAFEDALSRGWLDPEGVAESMRVPAARRALLASLRSPDEKHVALALTLCRYTRSAQIGAAVRACIDHPSPLVRAAAIASMESMRLVDRDRKVEALLADSSESVVRAAVSYLLEMSRRPLELARSFLEHPDEKRRAAVVEVVLTRPEAAPGAMTLKWIDERLESSRPSERALAARALGTISSADARLPRLRALLDDPDDEVRRAALQAAARRPTPALMPTLLGRLLEPEASYEARQAIAALGDAAVPALLRLVEGTHGPQSQILAARTLGEIGSPRATRALLRLARGTDLMLRHLGLQNASRVRIQVGAPVISRSWAHKLFLRELGEYRRWIPPSLELAHHPAPEVRLLGESCREFANMALERGIRALACWYDPRPLAGVFERLKTRETSDDAPAMEYLNHILPRQVFHHVMEIFEGNDPRPSPADLRPADVDAWVRAAWDSQDPWLRACAVRASRWALGPDPEWLLADGHEVVRAELEALNAVDDSPAWMSPRPQTAPEGRC
ncbi:MAG TPA: Npt1/Npt2 family nucleotide transporter, partial [Candidatus Eisenbacteria bacterium]|nr:Npt1/Npt2 family nucleotide transporter [Candidatus Eisenbacteria bacterium]